MFTVAQRGFGLDVIDRFEGSFSFVVTAARALGGAVDLPVDVACAESRRAGIGAAAGELSRRRRHGASQLSTASIPYELLGPPIRGPRALTDDWVAVLASDVQHRPERMEAPVLRIGARLLLAARAAAAAVRRSVRVLHGDRRRRRRPRHRAIASTARSCLASIVLFTFFAEATGGAVRCVVDNEALVRKIQFPRMVIPLSVVLLAMFNLALNLVVVLIFGLIQGVRPMLSWLELPLIVGLLAVLTTGAVDAACVAVRHPPGHAADLGGRRPDPVLRVSGDHSTRDRPTEARRRRRSGPSLHVQPAGDDPAAVPPRDDQPGGAQRRLRDGRNRGG